MASFSASSVSLDLARTFWIFMGKSARQDRLSRQCRNPSMSMTTEARQRGCRGARRCDRIVPSTVSSHPPHNHTQHRQPHTQRVNHSNFSKLDQPKKEAGSAEEGSWYVFGESSDEVCAEVHAVELRGRPDTRAEIVIAATFLLRNRSHIVRNVNERVWLLAQRRNLSLA